ncbi:MAG: hypothetical protein GY913_31780 [Proteobacteria bacterium]|nr:hypothetical protein [Pseudomonadota bacterium]MCP4921502.1 hypothetical protein [Pseudomonadota bacterium]
MTIQTAVPAVEGATPRLVEDYLLPLYGADNDTMVDCSEGDDVRDEFVTAWAVVEVQRWGIMANGSYTLSLSDGVLDGSSHNGNLLPLLYDQLVEWRLNAMSLSAGMRCWPEFPARLLLVAEKDMSWSIVQRVAYTAQQAGFEHVDLLVDDTATVSQATRKPPYPMFTERGPEIHEPRPRLSDEEIERARAQLAAGARIRSTGEACVDRLEVNIGSTLTTYEALPGHGGALAEPGEGTWKWDPVSIDGDGRLESVISADRDTKYSRIIEIASQLDHEGDVAFDTLSNTEPSYQSLPTSMGGTWLSYNSAQWISVIELTPERLGSALSCVDDAGTIWP